jgi:hypothetical protein
MRTGVLWLAGGAFVLAFAYSRIHPKMTLPSLLTEQRQEPEAKPDDDKQPEPMVKFVGPLANYMQEHPLLQITSTKPHSSKPHPSDHIAESPVGTSRAILHKTFAIRGHQDFLFEIPAHAAHPQLHGTYSSFTKEFGSDESADVEFLLLTEPQYQAMLAGRPSDALFAAEGSHSQDVDVGLPASSNRVERYHIIFRNVSGGAAQKIVEAEFTVDF